MTFQQIKAEALKLPEDSPAQLAQSLLLSLADAEDDPKHDQVWAEEAACRYRDLRENPESGVPAEEVFD